MLPDRRLKENLRRENAKASKSGDSKSNVSKGNFSVKVFENIGESIHIVSKPKKNENKEKVRIFEGIEYSAFENQYKKTLLNTSEKIDLQSSKQSPDKCHTFKCAIIDHLETNNLYSKLANIDKLYTKTLFSYNGFFELLNVGKMNVAHATIENFTSTTSNIGTLTANTGTIHTFTSTDATIEKITNETLQTTNASVTDLLAVKNLLSTGTSTLPTIYTQSITNPSTLNPQLEIKSDYIYLNANKHLFPIYETRNRIITHGDKNAGSDYTYSILEVVTRIGNDVTVKGKGIVQFWSPSAQFQHPDTILPLPYPIDSNSTITAPQVNANPDTWTSLKNPSFVPDAYNNLGSWLTNSMSLDATAPGPPSSNLDFPDPFQPLATILDEVFDNLLGPIIQYFFNQAIASFSDAGTVQYNGNDTVSISIPRDGKQLENDAARTAIGLLTLNLPAPFYDITVFQLVYSYSYIAQPVDHDPTTSTLPIVPF